MAVQLDSGADLDSMSPAQLEAMADELLADSLKSKKRNKSATEERPILSERQYARRLSMELPFSCLSGRLRREIGINW